MTTEDRFRAALNVIQNLPKDGPFQPSNEMKLKFYAHYKQATQGSCKQARPSFWDPIGRAKHDAWATLQNMSSVEAKEGYVKLLSQIVETMQMSADVETFMEVLGPFYDYVEDKISPIKSSAKEINGNEDNGTDSGEEELDNMLGRYPKQNSMPRTVSSHDVGSVTLNQRKTDMNHNCFTSTKEEDILEKDGDMLEKDDIIEELMVTSDEIRNASHLLQEIQRSLDEGDEHTFVSHRESSVEINELEETDFDDDESSKTTETVIHNSSHSSNLEESDDEIFEDSMENAQETPIHDNEGEFDGQDNALQSSSSENSPGGQDFRPTRINRVQMEQVPNKNNSGPRVSQIMRRDGSVESYYIGDELNSEDSQSPMLPPPTRGDRGAPTTSLPSTPLYPEEELVVYSSGGSQPSRILMRPLDKQAHSFNHSLMQRLEGEVEMVNSNLTHLTSRLEMMTSSLDHVVARLGSIEDNFQQVHARMNTIEYLMQVLLTREESSLMTRSNLTAVSIVTCAALLIAKVLGSARR